MKQLLDPPCLYCGYDSDDYWREGTHEDNCPFKRLDGDIARMDELPYIIRRWAAMLHAYRSYNIKQPRV